MGNSLINDIIAPELSQSGYGAGIKNVFEQIDANFKILGNQDFVKGDQGWSIGYNELHILYEAKDENNVKKTYFTKEGIDVLNAIIEEITDQRYVYDADDEEHQNIKTVKAWLETIDALKSVNDISLIDSIVPGDLFNEIYVYDPINPSNQYTIGATNDYVFKDRRFVIDVDSYDEAYSSLYDCSCMVHLQAYEEEDPDTGIKTPTKKFVVIQNAPTLYFDTNIQAFCWRIGGLNTGLIAQGPKGDSGQNAAFYIVELGDQYHPIPDAPAAPSMINVTKYMTANGTWVELAEHPAPADFDGSNCIAFEPTAIEGAEYGETPASYFGKIVKGEDESFAVSCSNENRIQTNLNLNWLAATFASIRVDKTLKGLFVPIVPPSPNSSYNDAPVHAIWHASMRNYASIFSELHISPMLTYAGIGTAASNLSGKGGLDGSRLSSYKDCIYKSRYSDNPVSLVFDYNNVIFAGHNDDDTNGVRIGIGTNDIFGNDVSIGSNSLVRFSVNSTVDMPGESNLNVSKIGANHISTGTLTATGNTSLGATTINGTATAKVNNVPNVYLGCPIGTVVMWAGTTVPEGWLLCDGSRIYVNLNLGIPIWPYATDRSEIVGGKEFTQDTYVKELDPLLQEIENKWGKGDPDPSTGLPAFWTLPDLQQRFPLGAGNLTNGEDRVFGHAHGIGEHGGEEYHTLSEDEMQHYHESPVARDAKTAQGSNGIDYYNPQTTGVRIDDTYAPTHHNNVPPYLAINFIIKYK